MGIMFSRDVGLHGAIVRDGWGDHGFLVNCPWCNSENTHSLASVSRETSPTDQKAKIDQNQLTSRTCDKCGKDYKLDVIGAGNYASYTESLVQKNT